MIVWLINLDPIAFLLFIIAGFGLAAGLIFFGLWLIAYGERRG